MTMGDRININRLAADLAEGHGCSVTKAFDGQSLQDQINAINELAKGQKLTGGTSTSHWRYSDNYINLKVEQVTSGFFVPNITLFSEKFDPIARKIHYECTDTSTNTSQSLDRRF